MKQNKDYLTTLTNSSKPNSEDIETAFFSAFEDLEKGSISLKRFSTVSTSLLHYIPFDQWVCSPLGNLILNASDISVYTERLCKYPKSRIINLILQKIRLYQSRERSTN
ncbi:MAG: hypothetical protein ACOX6V_00880 [Patescibacteria group bacterium]|jgi:hypothetical protein